MVMIIENGEIKLENTDLCGKCGTCVEMCPVFAIELAELEESK
jgi:4Fe-4S ferredoxin